MGGQLDDREVFCAPRSKSFLRIFSFVQQTISITSTFFIYIIINIINTIIIIIIIIIIINTTTTTTIIITNVIIIIVLIRKWSFHLIPGRTDTRKPLMFTMFFSGTTALATETITKFQICHRLLDVISFASTCELYFLFHILIFFLI